ncbi:MAG: hypothetical protein LBJ08_02405 [Bifidobacteriaceae bacterium]|jgi:hypothetical protein|nr:hypothetical protein [Bifidobacteriaceae bacterium]
MAPWRRGEAQIEALIAQNAVAREPRASGETDALMDRSRKILASARTLIDTDPVTAYVIAYDAARHAGMALLARQNLRATTAGGHRAVEAVIVGQFGEAFASFGTLRRRRHELDYPVMPPPPRQGNARRVAAPSRQPPISSASEPQSGPMG